MRLLGIVLVVVLAGLCNNVNCSPVDLELELKLELEKKTNSIDNSSCSSSSPEIETTEIPITMTTTTSPASGVEQEIKSRTRNKPEIENEETLKRRRCSGTGNQNRVWTESKNGNERLIPYPLCKPIQGLFYTGLCAVVCGLPLKSDENSCRFSNEDKVVFCDCGGAEEGEAATCGSGLERQTHYIGLRNPKLNPSAKVCRAICGQLGKSYDFCLSPTHARRAFCTCFDASRTQKKSNRKEIDQDFPEEKIRQEIPAPASINPVASSPAVEKEEEIADQVQDQDDDFDVDVDEAEEEDENFKFSGTGNRTAIKNLRQQNTGSCHPVLGAYKAKVCSGICGGSVKTCRVNKEYKTVYCDCPGNAEGPEAFCGRSAELYQHCFAAAVLKKRDCQNLCKQTGKIGQICLSPRNSQGLAMCSCFTG